MNWYYLCIDIILFIGYLRDREKERECVSEREGGGGRGREGGREREREGGREKVVINLWRLALLSIKVP